MPQLVHWPSCCVVCVLVLPFAAHMVHKGTHTGYSNNKEASNVFVAVLRNKKISV